VSFVAGVLKRPYTIAAAVILVCAMGVGAVQRMSIDIFPEIDIPVVSVVWTYSGMNPRDMQDRILTLHERQLASLVDDISRIESTAYNGVGVLKVYLHQGADVTRAISQLSSSALVILKSMPRNITPPLVLRYGATDVPIIQLSVSSPTLPDTKLNDIGQNIIRPDLAVVRGASIPYPYGGMPRVMMVDIDPQALQARGLTPTDVSDSLQKQNVILPSGDVKIAETITRSRRWTGGWFSSATSRTFMTGIRFKATPYRSTERPALSSWCARPKAFRLSPSSTASKRR
jgi:multidrug efflux pump subunit AcrB